jgi:hypothetical protein
MWRIRPRSLYDVLALLSFFLVLGGGTAMAAYLVSSNSQIGPGTVSGHHPPSGDHSNILTGSINGIDVQNGSLGSAKLAPSAVGARAYGYVSGTSVTRSKNITGVTNLGAGLFCVTLSTNINASATGAVVTPDEANDDTAFNGNGSQAIAEWRSTNCAPHSLEVRTGVRQVQASGGFVTSVDNVAQNEPFFIVVP